MSVVGENISVAMGNSRLRLLPGLGFDVNYTSISSVSVKAHYQPLEAG